MGESPEREIFTIGHSTHPIGRFLELLQRHAIVLVCDVRRTPYSRFNPQYNREPLRAALEAHGIAYLFLGDQLGGRPGAADGDRGGLARIGRTEGFRAGLERLLTEARERRAALMCAEQDPARCHRGLLICPSLPPGTAVRHILADGSIVDHASLSLGRKAADADQPSLF